MSEGYTQVDFDGTPSISGWTLSYLARNISDLDLPMETIVDVVQVFNSDMDNVQLLQEERAKMPPDQLPPGSTYGSFIDLRSDLADGTYSAYIQLDDENDAMAPSRRLTFSVEGGAITGQQVE